MRKVISITGMMVAFLVQEGRSQDVASELYQYNYFYINPAFRDSSDHTFSLAGNYYKANSLKGYSSILSYQGNIRKLNSSIGFQARSGKVGSQSVTDYGITVNHAFSINRFSWIVLGAKTYNQRNSIDNISYRAIHGGDPLIVDWQPDSTSRADWLFDVGLVFTAKRFFGGLSVIGLSSDDRRYGAVGGYSFVLSNALRSEHSVYGEFDNNNLGILDINNKLILKDRYLLGLTYRTQSAKGIIVSAGMDVYKGIRLMFLLLSNTVENKDFKVGTMAVIPL